MQMRNIFTESLSSIGYTRHYVSTLLALRRNYSQCNPHSREFLALELNASPKALKVIFMEQSLLHESIIPVMNFLSFELFRWNHSKGSFLLKCLTRLTLNNITPPSFRGERQIIHGARVQKAHKKDLKVVNSIAQWILHLH